MRIKEGIEMMEAEGVCVSAVSLSPAHYQFHCVGEDTIQSEGEAHSWKGTERNCLGKE